MKIGIFDSGIGGEALAQNLQKAFPQADIKVVNDRENIPYGDKTEQQIQHLTDRAIQPLLKASCDVVIVACNTATAVAIEMLRHTYPKQKFIGIEPMIKKAANLTESNVVAICATPATLRSQRYRRQIQKYAPHLTVIEPDCSQWAYMIEKDEINSELIEATINDACKQEADVIVLGCTHYHWIEERITGIANGRATVLQPSDAIGQRVKQLLEI